MMDTVTIALPNRPVITVHRGWTPSRKRGKISTIGRSVSAVDQKRFQTGGFSKFSRKGNSPSADSPDGETYRIRGTVPTIGPRKTSKRIEFINNAAEPLHTKGPAVRKLVRSHVMKEVARNRREQKKAKLEDAVTDCEDAQEAARSCPPCGRPMERHSEDDFDLVPPARGESEPFSPFGWKIDYALTESPSEFQACIRRLATLYFTQLGSAMFPIEFHLAYNPPQ